MPQLDALNNRAARVEQKLEPVNTGPDEFLLLLPHVSNPDLDYLAALFAQVEQRHGLKHGANITDELLTTDELTKLNHILEEARSHKEQGFPVYGPATSKLN